MSTTAGGVLFQSVRMANTEAAAGIADREKR
jgi:hypothetical protein